MSPKNWFAAWINRLHRGSRSTPVDSRGRQCPLRGRLNCEELEPRIGPAVVAPVYTFQNPTGNTNDWYGYSVALSGTDALIGAPAVNDGAGAVYLYNSTGQLLQTFLDPNGANNDYFGGAIALAGADVLIGAPSENNDTGGAYLFDSSGKLLQAFHDPDPGVADFGDAVALSGNYVLVGAAAHNGGTSAAYLFNTSGQLLQTFPVMQQVGTDYGDWVALSGTNVLVGSQGANGQTGVAYLYNTSGQLLHTFQDPGGNAGDFFGGSVALSGTEVAVGAVGSLSGAGAVYLYNTSGELLQTIDDPGLTSTDPYFATSVALCGTSVLVGASNPGGSTGAAYLYSTSGQLLQTFQDPDGTTGDGFGQSVALSGSNVLVGADDAAGLTNFPGATYLYSVPATTTTLQVSVNPVSITYGAALANSQLSGTATATINGQTVAVPGAFTYTSAAGTVPGAGNGQSKAVTFTPTDTTDYSIVSATVTVNVAQATPLVSINPVSITYGTALDDSQLSGTATWTVNGQTVSVAGTFTYTSADGTILNVGNGQSEAVTFTPNDATDYTAASTTVTVNVAPVPPQISALFGNNEITIVGTDFGTLLEAQVTDASGNPLAGDSVTFTVNNGSSGAGARFGGNTNVTVTTNAEGLAIAPVLTADTVAGSFSVTAAVTGASTTFLLSNISGTPANIVVVGGSDQSARIGSAYGTVLQVEVTDAYGNPVTGVAVTFSAPQSGASGAFNAVTTVPTNALGIATAPALTANDVAGSFNVTASVSGVGTPADFDLTNTAPAGSASIAAAITLPVPNGSFYFGRAVALSGDDVLVGTYLANGDQGAAYLYNTSGTLLQTFNDPGNTYGDGFGISVAMSGNDLLVGAFGANDGKGAAYLYNTSGTLLQTFNDPGNADSDTFGSSVAMSGNDLLVGADVTNDYKGAAYLYNTSGTLLQTFNDPGNTDDDTFGSSVALSGNDVLVGADFANGNTGAAYLYNTSGTLLQTFNDPGNTGGDGFGYSVAMSGNDLLVGAQGANSDMGAAYLYNTSGTLLQTFNDPGNTADDFFSNSVAMSGNDLLVGAVGTNDDTGAAYLYNTSGTLLQTFNDPGNTKVDQFGDSVALSGNDLLVGAYGTDSYNGAAYLYLYNTDEICALFGNNQSTTVGTAFGTALEAQVTESNPVEGASVTFTVIDGPAGAGASFAGNTTATVTTNLDGLAIAPVLTANDVAGSFTVTADSDGISATFVLTNTSGAPDHIAPFGGTPQSTVEGSAFGTLLQALVTDSDGNPVANVPVTFSAPASGPSGTFDAFATVPTNALGIATAPAFTANDTPGTFQVAATVLGLAAPAEFTLTNTNLTLISPLATMPWTSVVGAQLTELYQEYLPYKTAGQVASFVPSNDLESLDAVNGKVAVNVSAFVNTAAQVTRLGGQVTAVRHLPVAFGMPGVEVQAMLPIVEFPSLGALADVVSVTPEYRVGPTGSTAPSITTNPTDQTVTAGKQAKFSAAASGIPTPAVQWQVSSDGGKIFINVPGATSSTLTFTAASGQNGNQFRAVFSNKLGEASTTAATLTVTVQIRAAANALSGAISGIYAVPTSIPDVGSSYILSGSGTLGDLGSIQAAGELSTPGPRFSSTVGGSLTLSNAGGTVTLWLESMPGAGSSSLPQQFEFGVRSATGTYAGLSVQGTATILLSPPMANFDYESPQYGTLTLTIQAGTATNAGIKGVVLSSSQTQSDVLITAQPYGGGKVLAWTVSDYQGNFQLYLPAGKYLIQTSGLLSANTSETAVVPKNGFLRLIVSSPVEGLVHQPPTPALFANSFTYAALVGQTLTVDSALGLLTGAYDVAGKSVKVSAVNGRAANVGAKIVLASGATLTVLANGSFVYVPKGSSENSDSFTFTVSDGTHTASATVTVNLSTPWMYVSDASFVIPAGTSLTVAPAVGLLAGVPVSPGNAIQIAMVNGSAVDVGTAITLASGATLTVNADGSFSYVPAAGFQGQDSFTFSCDGMPVARTATIFVAPATS